MLQHAGGSAMKQWKFLRHFGFAEKTQAALPGRHISQLTTFDLERCGLSPERDHAPVIWTHATDYGWQAERSCWDKKRDTEI